ncbi:MAG: hypothetical protein ACI4RA_05575 [Kiritimatiellia bacterium]
MTVAECRELLARARALGLSGAGEAAAHPVECLARDCNGIGPEWLPAPARELLDRLAPDLRPAALVHDFRWSHSDGSRAAFDASNRELEDNCAIVARSFPWWNWRRYALRHLGVAFADVCSRHGLPAYLMAHASTTTENKGKQT